MAVLFCDGLGRVCSVLVEIRFHGLFYGLCFSKVPSMAVWAMVWLLEVLLGSQTSGGDLGSQIFSDLSSWFSMVTDGEFPCDFTEVCRF